MKTENMLNDDVIAHNFKAMEAMLAKSKDFFKTPLKKRTLLLVRPKRLRRWFR